MSRSVEEMVTHEPEVALEGWPESHVHVEDAFYTKSAECLCVCVHGCKHYLHQTTALALYQQLQAYFQNLSDADKLFLMLTGSELGPEITSVSGESERAAIDELTLFSFLGGVLPVDLVAQL